MLSKLREMILTAEEMRNEEIAIPDRATSPMQTFLLIFFAETMRPPFPTLHTAQKPMNSRARSLSTIIGPPSKPSHSRRIFGSTNEFCLTGTLIARLQRLVRNY